MTGRPIRVANFSGYLGDRFTAVDEAMAGDPVDVLVGDYLAEITLAALAARYQRDPARGYVEYVLDQVRPHLATLVERGTKVVTNAGGFHPEGLASALRELASEQGLPLRVAHVDGDNLLPRLAQLRASGHPFENLDTGQPLSHWGVEPIAANAYLGGWGIAAALTNGADIVVCGRVTDASLTAGAAAWWHEWDRDNWTAMAGAVTAGHVIECGPQAVGGNFSGFARIPDMTTPGFPIAEVAADGSSVITKHSRDGGAVTVDTVTAQLVYEIQGPVYLNPDVTVHLDTLALTSLGRDRVAVTGVTGSPPPPTTKVAAFAQLGYGIVNTVFVTAPDIDDKVELLCTQVSKDLPEGVELEFTRLGTAPPDPESQWDATVAVRIAATAREREPLQRLSLARRLTSLYLQSIPGFFHDADAALASTPKPRIDYWPALLPQGCLAHRVVLDGGRVVEVEPPADTAVTEQPSHPEPEGGPPATGERSAPLGSVAYARSGDKGGNCNVGVWVPDERAWPWLRRALSTEQLRGLLPEVKDLDIVRHELPGLRAAHFVLRGLLGTGGSANTRVDQAGKAVGEYLRAKYLPIPEELLTIQERDVAH